jgi:hypothetical protein
VVLMPSVVIEFAYTDLEVWESNRGPSPFHTYGFAGPVSFAANESDTLIVCCFK